MAVVQYTFTINVNFNGNGATANVPSSQSNSKTQFRPFASVSLTLSSKTPTRPNYTFAGWVDGYTGNVYQPGSTISWDFDDDTTYTYGDNGQYYASHTFNLVASWYGGGGGGDTNTIRVVSSSGTLVKYKIYVVNSSGSLVQYRATVVNSSGTSLINYS